MAETDDSKPTDDSRLEASAEKAYAAAAEAIGDAIAESEGTKASAPAAEMPAAAAPITAEDSAEPVAQPAKPKRAAKGLAMDLTQIAPTLITKVMRPEFSALRPKPTCSITASRKGTALTLMMQRLPESVDVLKVRSRNRERSSAGLARPAAQAQARPAAIVVEELDARFFKGKAHGRQVLPLRYPSALFKLGDDDFRHTGPFHQIGNFEIQESAGGAAEGRGEGHRERLMRMNRPIFGNKRP